MTLHPDELRIIVSAHLGVTATALRCIGDALSAPNERERRIHLQALEALSEIQDMVLRARRELGIDQHVTELRAVITFEPIVSEAA